MIIQVLSDLHVEFGERKVHIPVKAPILALLGDIGNLLADRYKELIVTCSQRWEHVVIVLGNHEYYEHDIWTLLEETKKTFKDLHNVHILDNEFIVLHGYEIVGSTLWASYGSMDKDKRVKDFKSIKGINVDLVNQMHDFSVDKIIKMTRRKRPRAPKRQEKVYPVILLTHFGPFDNTGKIDKHLLTNIVVGSRIRLWAFGHEHKSFDEIFLDTTLLSNPLGYPDEKNVGFKDVCTWSETLKNCAQF